MAMGLSGKSAGRPATAGAAAPSAQSQAALDELRKTLFSKFVKLQYSFQALDPGLTGEVNSKQFRKVLRSLGYTLSNEEFTRLVKNYDPTGSGKVRYKDFADQVSAHIKQPKIPAGDGSGSGSAAGSPGGARRRSIISEPGGAGGRPLKLAAPPLGRPPAWGGIEARPETPAALMSARDSARRARRTAGGGGATGGTTGGAAGGGAPPSTPAVARRATLGFARKCVENLRGLSSSFAKFDKAGTGLLSHDNFVAGLRNHGMKLTRQEVINLVRLFDPRSSGKISLREFSRGMVDIANGRMPRAGMHAAGEPETKPPTPEAYKPEFHHSKLVSGMGRLDADHVEQQLKNKMFTKFKRVQDAFRLFDKDKSGKITHNEFRTALETLGYPMTEEEFVKFIKTYDKDGDGYVSYVEFNNNVGSMIHPGENGRLMFKKHEAVGERPSTPVLSSWVESKFAHDSLGNVNTIVDAFNKFDTDSSGALSGPEFIAALKSLGIIMTDEQYGALIEKYDTSGDGLIQLSEFEARFVESLKRPASPTAAAAYEREQEAKKKGKPPTISAATVKKKLQEHIFTTFSKVQNAYRIMDTDHSGMISHDEFRQSLAMMGLEMSDTEFAKFIKEYDPSNDGLISYTEFNNRIGELIHPSESGSLAVGSSNRHNVAGWVEEKFAKSALEGMHDVEKIFRQFDWDDSGTLSPAEFEQALRHFGIHLRDAEVAELFESYDRDHDGRISYQEFQEQMAKTLSGKLADAAGRKAGAGETAKARARAIRMRRKQEKEEAAMRNAMRRAEKEAKLAAMGKAKREAAGPELPPRPASAAAGTKRGGLVPVDGFGGGEEGADVLTLTYNAVGQPARAMYRNLSDTRPPTPMSVLSAASTLSTAGELEARMAGGGLRPIGGYKSLFKAFRVADADEGPDTGTLPVEMAHDVLMESGVELSAREMKALMRKHARHGRFDYVSFMRRSYLDTHAPTDVAIPARRAQSMRRTLSAGRMRPQTAGSVHSAHSGSLPPRAELPGSPMSMTGDLTADKVLRHHVRKEWKALRRSFSSMSRAGGSGLIPKRQFERVLRSHGVPLSGKQTRSVESRFGAVNSEGVATQLVDYNAFLKTQLLPA